MLKNVKMCDVSPCFVAFFSSVGTDGITQACNERRIITFVFAFFIISGTIDSKLDS